MELSKFEKAQAIRDEIRRCSTHIDMLKDMSKEKGSVRIQMFLHGGCLSVPVPAEMISEITKRLTQTLQGKINLLEQQFKEL